MNAVNKATMPRRFFCFTMIVKEAAGLTEMKPWEVGRAVTRGRVVAWSSVALAAS